MHTIGALAEQTATTTQTILYFEQIGLMPAPERWEDGTRVYSAAQRDRLVFICNARDLGFGLEAIRELLDLSDRPNSPCDAACGIARRHLADVEGRIARLRRLQGELGRMLSDCRATRVAECRVLEALQSTSVPATTHRPDSSCTCCGT